LYLCGDILSQRAVVLKDGCCFEKAATMIDRAEARKIAAGYLARHLAPDAVGIDPDTLAINEKATIEKPYGWVFFWTTKRELEAVEAGREIDLGNVLLGNAPFLVERGAGEICQFGTARSVEWFLDRYERERGFTR